MLLMPKFVQCDISFLFIFRIIPESAHPAYDKAAQYLNIKVCRVPVNKEFVADVKGIRRCINNNTILVSKLFFINMEMYCLVISIFNLIDLEPEALK